LVHANTWKNELIRPTGLPSCGQEGSRAYVITLPLCHQIADAQHVASKHDLPTASAAGFKG